MGDFGEQTAVTATGESTFRGTLDDDWEIWGPNGGYVATLALRAAGAVSRFDRPANCTVQFLGVAAFDEVTCEVDVLKATRRADALRVMMRQGDKPILQLNCWAVTDDLLDRRHSDLEMPSPPPEQVPTTMERFAEHGIDPDQGPPYPFWNNFTTRPLDFVADWESRGVLPPRWRQWHRFEPTATSEDPWLEAGRILLLADLGSWPAAHRAHPPDGDPWIAPSLDVACHFTDLATTEWLLADHHSPAARDGLVGATGNVWSSDGRLLASAVTQLLATAVR